MSMSLPAVTVGTDGSPHAARAVRWAAEEAALRRLPLRIVHVVEEPVPMAPPGVQASLAAAGEKVLAEARRAAHEHRPELTVTTALEHGPVRAVLLERSKEAFTVVLGHRGLGGFASMLLGSTGLQVVGHAQGPVIIVRGDPGPEHGEIVAGLDLYADCEELLAYAFDEASLRGARLRVLHAFQLAETLVAAGGYEDVGQVEEGLRRQLGESLARWRERYQSVRVVEEVVREHPVEALTAASRQADLVVVSARGRSALRGALLGSVSHGLIHHAACPVAVIGPRG